MNLKHGEGAYCKKEPHIHSGLIQWFHSNRLHKCASIQNCVCMLARMWSCVTNYSF